MTVPGIAMFNRGLIRRRRVLSVAVGASPRRCVLSVGRIMFGYSMAFSGS